MAQTYKQIQKQIEQLQRQAEVLRSSEVKGVVDRIKVAIAHYGLTAAQLGLGTSKTVARPKKAREIFGQVRCEVQRRQWQRLVRPRTAPSRLRDALTAGRSIDEFRVGSRRKSKPVSAASESGETAAPAALPARKKAKRTAKIRYKDDAGNSWSGFGPKPRWLKAALDAGKSLEDLAK